MRPSFGLLLALSIPLASTARADGGSDILAIDQAQSSVTYHLVHKLHKFDGVSKKLEGRARALPTGQVQVGVRAQVESFDSGNVNRDEHMKETVDASRFPTVEVKALMEGVTPPATFPSTIDKQAKVQITLHGVQESLDVPVQLVFESADRVRVTTSFNVSVEGFKIERPSLMFVKIDDAMKVDAKLVFVRNK